MKGSAGRSPGTLEVVRPVAWWQARAWQTNAALLFLGKYRLMVGWVLAIFFVAVFPGNLSQYTNHRDALGMHSENARFVRLFFQPVLIIWTLWCTGCLSRKN